MRKDQLSVGDIVAVHTGFGKPSASTALMKAEVKGFDWVQPQPEGRGSSSYTWDRNHTGTRLRIIESPHEGGLYKVGAEVAMPNRKIVAPWDEWVRDHAKAEIWRDFRSVERFADREAREAIEAAFETYRDSLDLSERDAGKLSGWGSVPPSRLGRFARAAIDAGPEKLEEFESLQADAIEAAKLKIEDGITTRDEKLKALGVDLPEREEIEVGV